MLASLRVSVAPAGGVMFRRMNCFVSGGSLNVQACAAVAVSFPMNVTPARFPIAAQAAPLAVPSELALVCCT